MPDTVHVWPVETMPDTVHVWPNPDQYEISLHPNQIHQVPPCSAPGPVTISDTARKPPTLVTITDEMTDFTAEIVSRREFQDPESLVPSSSSMTDDTLEICKDYDNRIESWPFEIKDGLPIIQTVLDLFTENACIVVRNCIIKNDASVDVSRTGDKLVAFIPDKTQEGGVIVCIFSLLRNNLGQLLGSYGPVPTPVSISFSPHSQFLLMGLESTRSSQWASIVSPDLHRSFNRRNEIEHPKNFRINQVKWLLNKESLFAIATNGAVILVKPRVSVKILQLYGFQPPLLDLLREICLLEII
ncbi:hypothetical protein TNCT_11171 [Trichonephila clavata]|uniref:Uncharacterized protein n=1 Tax=Trichonephila clavata TaxID=2740835 RepID=A0A8X6J7N8_TRICU|nr:hypothetical protein TNCT_11171 [Trichonephila clavata]